jgi:hypothetical protein
VWAVCTGMSASIAICRKTGLCDVKGAAQAYSTPRPQHTKRRESYESRLSRLLLSAGKGRLGAGLGIAEPAQQHACVAGRRQTRQVNNIVYLTPPPRVVSPMVLNDSGISGSQMEAVDYICCNINITCQQQPLPSRCVMYIITSTCMHNNLSAKHRFSVVESS